MSISGSNIALFGIMGDREVFRKKFEGKCRTLTKLNRKAVDPMINAVNWCESHIKRGQFFVKPVTSMPSGKL
jgi:hypothetical protein